MISHATPVKRDIAYTHNTEETTVAIRVHHCDGTTEDSVLVLNPDQTAVLSIQVEQAISKRETARQQR
ncbi:hypothetical protein [Streptomyces sp. NPDC017993]|uniref:hypothetical protein n=1 Tax=Streptomyces sp. NPDC017993 TaxID=3365027 RepID=UPI00378748F5